MADSSTKIKTTVMHKLKWLSTLPENTCRAQLAELRRGVGHAPGDIPALWGMIFSDLPEEYYSKNGEPTAAEWAIYLALTMFACHQQGHDFKSEWMHVENISFGKAVGRLALKNIEGNPEQENDAIKRISNRFNRIATAADMSELSYHLRNMITLLRAEDIGLDYAALAEDLYWYQSQNARAKVRLRWGEDFWRTVEPPKNDKNKNNEQE